MSDNVKELLDLAIAGVAVVFIGIKVFLNMKKAGRIDSSGVKAQAVVAEVIRTRASDDSWMFETKVRFTDKYGESHVCKLDTSIEDEYEEGQELTIKYIPGDYSMVRPA